VLGVGLLFALLTPAFGARCDLRGARSDTDLARGRGAGAQRAPKGASDEITDTGSMS
jgi:hypothetical protein